MLFYLKLIVLLGIFSPNLVVANEDPGDLILSQVLLKTAVVKKDLPQDWKKIVSPKKVKDLAHSIKDLLENADAPMLYKLFDHPNYSQWGELYQNIEDKSYQKFNKETTKLTVVDIVHWLDATKRYVSFLLPVVGKFDSTDALHYIPLLIDKVLLKIYTGCWGISNQPVSSGDKKELIDILKRATLFVRADLIDMPSQERNSHNQQWEGHFQVIKDILKNASDDTSGPGQRRKSLLNRTSLEEKNLMKAILSHNSSDLSKLRGTKNELIDNFLMRFFTELQHYPNQKKSVLKPLTASFLKTQEIVKTLNHPKLILGVNTGVEEMEKFDENCVFLDIQQNTPEDPRALKVDFNSLPDLFLLSKVFPSTFDEIILDRSTFKFAHWTSEHLQYFKIMLKSGGKFIFGPFLTFGIDEKSFFKNWEELSEFIQRETNLHNTDRLITSYVLPLELPPPSGEVFNKCQTEINQLIQQCHQLKNGEKEAVKNVEKLTQKLNITESDLLKFDEDRLQKFVINRVYTSTFNDNFIKNTLVPKNYQRIVEEVFGKGHVNVEYDGKLPSRIIPLDEDIIITAIKKR